MCQFFALDQQLRWYYRGALIAVAAAVGEYWRTSARDCCSPLAVVAGMDTNTYCESLCRGPWASRKKNTRVFDDQRPLVWVVNARTRSVIFLLHCRLVPVSYLGAVRVAAECHLPAVDLALVVVLLSAGSRPPQLSGCSRRAPSMRVIALLSFPKTTKDNEQRYRMRHYCCTYRTCLVPPKYLGKLDTKEATLRAGLWRNNNSTYIS